MKHIKYKYKNHSVTWIHKALSQFFVRLSNSLFGESRPSNTDCDPELSGAQTGLQWRIKHARWPLSSVLSSVTSVDPQTEADFTSPIFVLREIWSFFGSNSAKENKILQHLTLQLWQKSKGFYFKSSNADFPLINHHNIISLNKFNYLCLLLVTYLMFDHQVM